LEAISKNKKNHKETKNRKFGSLISALKAAIISMKKEKNHKDTKIRKNLCVLCVFVVSLLCSGVLPEAVVVICNF
jgi:hypothetical protein